MRISDWSSDVCSSDLRSMPELPKLSQPEVLARHEDDGTVELLIRYRFDGDLSSAARAVLDPSRLSWVERSVHEVAGRSGSFTMEPDHYGDRFRCTGTFRYDETGEGCVQSGRASWRERVCQSGSIAGGAGSL